MQCSKRRAQVAPASHGWLPHRGANLGCDYPATARPPRGYAEDSYWGELRAGCALRHQAWPNCRHPDRSGRVNCGAQLMLRVLGGLYAEATRLSSCLKDSSRQQMRCRGRSSKRNPTASGPAVFSFAANACMAINITDRCAFSTGFSTSKPTDLRASPTIRMSLSHPLSWW